MGVFAKNIPNKRIRSSTLVNDPILGVLHNHSKKDKAIERRCIMAIREVYPTKYYSKEGFVERKIEINEEDLQEIIEDYFLRNTEFDFDEIEIVNNRPMNIWLYAKCRKYIDQDNPKGDEALNDAEIEIIGDYDGNPT